MNEKKAELLGKIIGIGVILPATVFGILYIGLLVFRILMNCEFKPDTAFQLGALVSIVLFSIIGQIGKWYEEKQSITIKIPKMRF